MRTFMILWVGQLVSSVGSSMTYFALTLWIWQQTESATAIALVLVFYQLPQIAVSLVSGMLVDRLSRKHLLIFSDTAAAYCTISIGILAAFQMLQLWHVYLVAAIIGCFGNIQSITYSTLIPLIVPPQHHTRASSLGTMIGYAAGILSPALAGLLYPRAGLLGITLIDMGTFAIALLTLLPMAIPDLPRSEAELPSRYSRVKTFWQDTTLGFRYITSQPSLRAMVIVLSLFTFFNQASEVLYQPMILAKTGGDAQLLGSVVAASGVGGVVGAIALGVWGGFRRRVLGMIWGIVGTGLSKLGLGLGQAVGVWAIAQFGASLHSPLIFSSYMAVWYAKVPPTLQGRVFAADYVIGTVVEASAGLSAGLLADRLFEPAIQSGGWLAMQFGALVGNEAGSGIALFYLLNAMGILLVGIASFKIKAFREAEFQMPDQDVK